MLVKHNKCYMTKSGNALKVQFVKDHNNFNVEIGLIRPNGDIDWEYHSDMKSISEEVEIDWVEKEICSNYDIILKFLCGETIQYYNTVVGEWIDVDPFPINTLCLSNHDLRVKVVPEYRILLITVEGKSQVVAVNSNDSFTNEKISTETENSVYFTKWLTDWIKVE